MDQSLTFMGILLSWTSSKCFNQNFYLHIRHSLVHGDLLLVDQWGPVWAALPSKARWGVLKRGQANLLAFSENRWCGIVKSLQRSALWSQNDKHIVGVGRGSCTVLRKQAHLPQAAHKRRCSQTYWHGEHDMIRAAGWRCDVIYLKDTAINIYYPSTHSKLCGEINSEESRPRSELSKCNNWKC